MLTRRQFSQHIAIGTAATLTTPWAFAQSPALSRLIVGSVPGSSFDAFARRVAEKLKGSLASNVIVENKPGAGNQIAVTTLKDSPADGSSLLISPSSLFTINQYTHSKLPYSLADVKPVAMSVTLEPCIAVGPAVPESVQTLKQLFAWMKEDPSRAAYGSPGAGSMLHLIGDYMDKVLKVNWRHVSYRGAAPAIQDLIGGQISSVILPIGEFLPHVKTGKVRILAVSSKTRSRFLPQVQTLRENGVVLSVGEWYGFYLPAAASPDLVRRTAAYLQVALNQPDMLSWSSSAAMQMNFQGPDQTATHLKADAEEWRGLIKMIGFKAES